ncbi:MAG: leucine-rich repeat domain-containing protein [Clostridia bacterium]|nr:leucine-rich repeat domain-containing protein [Clostridia bacterium]
MKVKKHILSILALLMTAACAFGVAGCNKESGSKDKSGDSQQEQGGNEDISDSSESADEKTDAEDSTDSEGDEQEHVHSYILKVAEKKYLKSEATCTDKAVYYKSCKCEEAGEDTFEYGEALGHIEDAPVCERCRVKVYSDGLEYTLSNDKTYYAVTGIGNCEDPDIIIPQKCDGLPVTAVGGEAFKFCRNLTSVTIPDSVTSIGKDAFYYCDALTSVTLGKNVMTVGDYAFALCTKLTDVYYRGDIVSWCGVSFGDMQANPLYYAEKLYIDDEQVSEIVVPDGVTEVKAYAFYGCDGLISVTMENSVIFIGENAFRDCVDLERVVFSQNTTFIGEAAFLGCSSLTSVAIPQGVGSVLNSTFSGCSSLTRVDLSEGIASIGESAFRGCGKLTSVIVPASVTFIGKAAFGDCGSLESITLPFVGGSATANLENSVFGWIFGCAITTSLNSAIEEATYQYMDLESSPKKYYYYYIPASLRSVTLTNETSLADYAFWNCANLTSITLSEKTVSIGECAFLNCSNLITFELPQSVTSLGANSAFNNCSSLTSIAIPEGVETIGPSTFSDCGGLLSVTLPESLTVIGNYAFKKCENLTSITIGKGVTNIGIRAFIDCVDLTSIRYEGTIEEWNLIEKGNEWNDNISATEIICSDGTVTLE